MILILSGSKMACIIYLDRCVQDGEGKKGSKATIGCEGEEDDLIVSIMLPSPKAVDSEKENRSFTAVDEIYVVAVRPGKEYHTHACSLQNPILI